jgi:hypothetical protein
MKTAVMTLSVGAWHLLFQIMGFGNPTAGGFKTMDEVLRAVEKLNKKLRKLFGIEFAVSAHWWHELRVPSKAPKIGYSAKWNNPRAIGLRDWIKGVKAGYYPKIGRIIPPGFGLPGSDDGAFTNPDAVRRQLAHDMMVYSFEMSELVKSEGVGNGDVIFWTGPDGIRWKRLVEGKDINLSYEANPKLEEWRMIVDGLVAAIREAREKGYVNTRLLIEGKAGGDPCYLDVFTDNKLAIQGIREINDLVGFLVAYWQDELCHRRGGGQRFCEGMQEADDADVFDGSIHFNAGGIASINFSKLLSVPGGTPMSKFQQYVDPDFLPGEGVEEWVDDQKKTIALGKKWSARTGLPFKVEFDARFCRYKDMMKRLEQSAIWTIEQFKAAA